MEIDETDSNRLAANTSAVFTMSYEQRAVDLDSLEASPGQVLTGIKLRKLGGHLNLEIQTTPVKFREGKLLSDRSTWIGNDNTPATDKPRTFVPIIMPDVPTKLSGRNKVDSTHDEYLQFDATSAHKDVSQTTIPFIDSQPVSPRPSTWLAGARPYSIIITIIIIIVIIIIIIIMIIRCGPIPQGSGWVRRLPWFESLVL